ncbi:MAG: acyl-CoA dehydrogenase family protein [Propionibacteriaceae bacterium]|nr:acyl-CoA dehydrogenase family protein [Propionibacteriaceae bacterium]
MDTSELNDLRSMVRRRLDVSWGPATSADSADIAALWQVAAEDGLFQLADLDAADGLITAMSELGRVACPLPLADGFAACLLFGEGSEVSEGVAGGDLCVSFAANPSADQADAVEVADAATHVLIIPAAGGTAELRPILRREATPGLARPSWSAVEFGPASHSIKVDAATADKALVVLRLALSARALAAATVTHELAIEHAKTRIQFGQPIGSFGAVQQRTATCQIDVSGGEALIARALAAYADSNDDWMLAAELATTFIAGAARRVQLGAHHTLAASGYFDEHVGPWLFRRIHADVVRAASITRTAGSVADVLVETAQGLPQFALDETGEAFRTEVRAMIDQVRHPDGSFVTDEVTQAIVSHGWLGFGWPERYGGRGASFSEQVVLHDELVYNRTDGEIALGSVMLLGNSILTHGTDEQKDKFLPIVRRGEMVFCLGYSEPEVGSDLASVRTRAVRDGDDWVIDGQKIWTTGGHTANYIWLATRTDPEAKPRHAGITVFLVPMDTPGISVQPMTALSGGISTITFLDQVRVPDSARVGPVNGGWKVITDALAGERVLMGGIANQLHRQLDDVLAFVRTDPTTVVGPRGSASRERLGDLAATLQALRALVASAIGATAQGSGARFEAPMAGVLGGELSETFGETMLDILGPVATLQDPSVPGGGELEHSLRLSIMYVVGGGTNDIQRGLIARGLGLPR